jgi:hypothetical protein
LKLGHDDLALDTHLLGEFIDPDLGHFTPVSARVFVRATVDVTSWAYSSLGAHRVLMVSRPALRVVASRVLFRCAVLNTLTGALTTSLNA